MPVDPTVVSGLDLSHAPQPVKAAAAVLSDALATAATARTELGAAQERIRTAQDQDVRDTAVAMAAHKPDPGRQHSDAAAVALAAAGAPPRRQWTTRRSGARRAPARHPRAPGRMAQRRQGRVGR